MDDVFVWIYEGFLDVVVQWGHASVISPFIFEFRRLFFTSHREVRILMSFNFGDPLMGGGD